MEKMSFYLYVSAGITLGLALLSYLAEAVGRRLSTGQALLATEPQISFDEEVGSGSWDGVGRYGTMLTWMGAVLLLMSLTLRSMVSGRGPFSNMHEFSIAFALGVTVVYLLVNSRYAAHTLGLVALPVALGMMAYAASVSSTIQPLVPALQNSTLLTLHVAVAIIAYGAFAVSFGAAVLYLIQERANTRLLPGTEALDEMGFLSAALGFPFMALVLILGAYWANVAWGRYWGWDPKETASLVTWLLYAAYLHTRALRDWRGRRSALLLVVGFAAVMMTYYGNLFFGGLHSYAK